MCVSGVYTLPGDPLRTGQITLAPQHPPGIFSQRIPLCLEMSSKQLAQVPPLFFFPCQ